jgi:hypothetical protein
LGVSLLEENAGERAYALGWTVGLCLREAAGV